MHPTDPPPTIDPDLPAFRQALTLIRLELALVRNEHPEMTPHQQFAEARRRCAKAMVAAADAVETRRIARLRKAQQRARIYGKHAQITPKAWGNPK